MPAVRRLLAIATLLLVTGLVPACADRGGGAGSPAGGATGGASGGTNGRSGGSGPSYGVAGWLPYWAGTNGEHEIDTQTGRGLDEVNLFGFALQADGAIAARSGIDDPQRIARIRSRGGQVIPTVYDVHDAGVLDRVLASSAACARAIVAMLDLVERGGYDGLDIDFEHVRRATRDAFSQLVRDLGRRLRARGKVFSVTVPGKRRDAPSWAGYDYAALGAAADRVKIMSYGYSGPWSRQPGPIAPTDWIRQLLDYAVSTMPAHKIQLGIPFYGYDWPAGGGRVRSVTYPRGLGLLAQSHTGLVYEPARGEAWFEYLDPGGGAHTVWFSDERSVAAKVALVRSYRLGGLAIWALGYGGEPVWDAIRAELGPAVP